MAGNVNGTFNQPYRVSNDIPKGKVQGAKPKAPSKADNTKASTVASKFGESASLELSPEVEMYGKVVDLLQRKYENADVFVASKGDDLSQIGGDLEYSIILSENEMKLLASDDPSDKEAKDKLLKQIDDAMTSIDKMSQQIGENTDEKDEISNFGISVDKNGKMNFFADINGNSYKGNTLEDIVSSLLKDKSNS
ncbi:DUF6033 family protein [Butyrivibrio proteoclasticus]|uniref:DUF6033 family protein n=1 Tax=Butyrivibrio proteoclasticus TaxID=43305 RepID=UPI00047C8CD2|nr:DUF6033 family protein [Butyrivibrio proteoclasticus]